MACAGAFSCALSCGEKLAVKKNVLPLPGALSSQMRPFSICTRRTEMASPSPLPPYLRQVAVSACKKGSKIRACLSLAMPIPVSLMLKRQTISPALHSCPTRITTAP